MVASSFWFWDRPSWGEAELWALAFLLVPSLLIRPGGKSFLAGLVTGTDNRWSTSKASVVLWTYGLLFVFIAILLHTRGHGLDQLTLSDQYLLLLGIPAGTAVASKAITQAKVESGQLAKTTAPAPPNAVAGTGQLFSDDSGNPDLLDAQYFAFSLLLLAYFFTQFLSGESTTLPNLPDTLVGLTGVSALSYTAKKGVKNQA
jgi:hypothetical protein